MPKLFYKEHGDDEWKFAGYSEQGVGMTINDDEDLTGDEDLRFNPDFLKTYTMDVSFQGVDPELLDLLTGQNGETRANLGASSFSLEAWNKTPIKRNWWQWLLRRPREYVYDYTFLPNVAMASPDEFPETREEKHDG